MAYNDTSHLVKLPKGNIERYKIYSVAKEFTQQEDIDFK